MTAHHWQLSHIGHGISRGTCSCGAVKYYPDILGDIELQRRADNLNQEQGVIKVHEEEKVMAAIEIETPGISQEIKLPEVPQKPLGRGLRITKYYEKNKEQILTELQTVGRDKTCEHWGIRKAMLRQLLRRWGGVLPSKPISAGVRETGNLKASSRKQDTLQGNTDAKKPSIIAFPEFSKDWNALQMQIWFNARERELAKHELLAQAEPGAGS